MRRALLVGLAIGCWAGAVLLVPLTGGVAAPSPAEPEVPDQSLREEVVRPIDGESGVWPWIAPDPRFDRHARLDVVVLADGERVVGALDAAGAATGSGAGASGAGTPPANVEPATERDWEPTVGSARYAYVERRPGEGGWVRESAHLQDGHYYGRRVHLRCYASPDDREEWLAIEAHAEHFDWFALRHRVEDVGSAPAHVRSDLATAPGVEAALLERGEQDGDDHPASAVPREGALAADQAVPSGASLSPRVALALVLGVPVALFVPAVVGGRSRRSSGTRTDRASSGRRRDGTGPVRRQWLPQVDPRTAGLVALVVGTLLGVRAAGVLLERHSPTLTAYQIAVLGYPVLAVGLPVAVRTVARGVRRPVVAGAATAFATVTGVALDYAAIGVEVVPTAVVLHRIGLALALGLLAAGAAVDSTRTGTGAPGVVRVAGHRAGTASICGELLWLGLLLLPLL